MSHIAVRIAIPQDVRFADLKMARDPDGAVSVDWAVIERVCAASGLDVAVLRDAPEDNLAGLLTAWYREARAAGEPADPVFEDLIAETMLEDELVGGLSHPPARA